MLSKLIGIFQLVKQKYLVEVCYLEKQGADNIPVGTHHQYLVCDNEGNITGYTTDAEQASIFTFALGTLIVLALRKNKKDYPNLDVSMVSVSDAQFINNIIKPDTNATTI